MTTTAEPTGPEDWSDANDPPGPRQRVNPPDPQPPTRPAHPTQPPMAGDRPAAAPVGDPTPPVPGQNDNPGPGPGRAVAQLQVMARTFDNWVDQPFVRLRGNKVADRLFYGASEAANFSVLWHAMAWTPVLLRPTPHRVVRALGTSGSLAVESVLVNGPVKSVFRRTRPVLEQDHLHVHHLRTPRSTSFPSGHASAALVACMVMGRGRHWLPRLLLAAAASVVSASRIHVRIHHPSDVVGGAMIGWLLGRVLRRVLP
ncbi:MAG: phosphatase PAP2 family protein [Acidimicrobiales bacterium]